MIDETHAASASSWVEGAAGHREFPVQNLPYGIFTAPGAPPRAGVAIGDHVLGLGAAADLLDGRARSAAQAVGEEQHLNRLLAEPAESRAALRQGLFRLLSDRSFEKRVRPLLFRQANCQLGLPAKIGDYTDFYAGIHHARAVGALLRPDNPLLPNYKYVPIGYHGRASTVRASGADVVRPRGQVRAGDTPPALSETRRLDLELELGLWVGGAPNDDGPVPISAAASRIAGLSLLNDWSARDVQAWEYQPLGPFLAKNFLTTVSPWIVTTEALAPFRVAPTNREPGDPSPLDYLFDRNDQSLGAYDIRIRATLQTERMRQAGIAPVTLGTTSAMYLYWTPAQLVAHHTVNGCTLVAGDLLGTGTISGPDDASRGSLMELSRGGREPIDLPTGEQRTFLEDGDVVELHGWAEADGFARIGFGPCVGKVVAATR
ncbi:fumarylacetoacetase [Rhizorhabdus wittichii RW1]|uniref:fumarylacetoacetase n=1 Tax=Rhizorhabdus wittichii (strain DSM 6014 / CCUG 31198 / JCM 15750 / NBRC 105917 / EY 4224 / RW1) TaxID=392499 RepID=A0A9J9HA97_RHIWR|nr:fumarylacetoacetase [Rhizorhabdus wittichii RW1]